MDHVNVMTYDGKNHGTLQQFKDGLTYWKACGARPKKLNMGVPFYACPDLHCIPPIEEKTKIALKEAGRIISLDADEDLSLVNAIFEVLSEE
ncbi:MAG: hypothetical protein HXY38_13850 [Chloroflexi bacterium]|nr:hypothetical protein [Chloroflexota bacterium]